MEELPLDEEALVVDERDPEDERAELLERLPLPELADERGFDREPDEDVALAGFERAGWLVRVAGRERVGAVVRGLATGAGLEARDPVFARG